MLLNVLMDQAQWESNVVSTYLHALMYLVIVCNMRNKTTYFILQFYRQLEQNWLLP